MTIKSLSQTRPQNHRFFTVSQYFQKLGVCLAREGLLLIDEIAKRFSGKGQTFLNVESINDDIGSMWRK